MKVDFQNVGGCTYTTYKWSIIYIQGTWVPVDFDTYEELERNIPFIV